MPKLQKIIILFTRDYHFSMKIILFYYFAKVIWGPILIFFLLVFLVKYPDLSPLSLTTLVVLHFRSCSCYLLSVFVGKGNLMQQCFNSAQWHKNRPWACKTSLSRMKACTQLVRLIDLCENIFPCFRFSVLIRCLKHAISGPEAYPQFVLF